MQKNLFGLEIDDRAAQLAAFALMMKARADDRRIFGREVQPNVLAIQESKGLDAKKVTDALNRPLESDGSTGDIKQADVAALINLFEHGKTFGSLIRVPEELAAKLPAMTTRVEEVAKHGGIFENAAAKSVLSLVEPAGVLAREYDAVATNPPYMNRKYLCESIDSFLKNEYKEYSEDLYAAFINRCVALGLPTGFISMITMDSWMFGDDFNNARSVINSNTSLVTNAHLGPRAFDEISGEVVQTCAFVLIPHSIKSHAGSYFRLVEPRSSEAKRLLLLSGTSRFDVEKEFFDVFPRKSMAYFATRRTQETFKNGKRLAEFAEAFTGLQTGDNERFIRSWSEVAVNHIEFGATPETARESTRRWFPYVKGSEFRKWYGNLSFVANWESDGKEIRDHRSSTVRNSDYYFLPGLAYNNIAKSFSARLVCGGAVFDQKNSMLFAKHERFLLGTLGFLNSKIVDPLLKVVAPKDFNPGSLKALPVNPEVLEFADLISNVEELVGLAKRDWNSSETSWDFERIPWMPTKPVSIPLVSSWTSWRDEYEAAISRTRELEARNNEYLLMAYGLEDEIEPTIDDDQITLYQLDRTEDIKRLISYAIGCMMGRYSLDKPGLIYAHSGNKGFDHEIHKIYEKKKTECLSSGSCASRDRCLSRDSYFSRDSCVSWFAPDQDGIIPLMETEWFSDDATNRLVEFISVAWPDPSPQPLRLGSGQASPQGGEGALLEENLKFIADSLGPNRGEQPHDTIRRYFATSFFKDHLKTYKRRPIYWLFSSGKQRAFQCLVYLHRYHEGTLSRMRTEYVIPLQGKIAARIDHLAADIAAAASTSHRRKLEKERDTLVKQQVELQTFDEKLRHYADQRISLDLDDGVKVNYGKFGDLLGGGEGGLWEGRGINHEIHENTRKTQNTKYKKRRT